jgi:hypothetical protein
MARLSPIAFGVQSAYAESAGYFGRVGVLREHWGRALQLRLMRAAEARARINGWALVISDTTDNVPWAIGFTGHAVPLDGRTLCIGGSPLDGTATIEPANLVTPPISRTHTPKERVATRHRALLLFRLSAQDRNGGLHRPRSEARPLVVQQE